MAQTSTSSRTTRNGPRDKRAQFSMAQSMRSTQRAGVCSTPRVASTAPHPPRDGQQTQVGVILRGQLLQKLRVRCTQAGHPNSHRVTRPYRTRPLAGIPLRPSDQASFSGTDPYGSHLSLANMDLDEKRVAPHGPTRKVPNLPVPRVKAAEALDEDRHAQMPMVGESWYSLESIRFG